MKCSLRSSGYVLQTLSNTEVQEIIKLSDSLIDVFRTRTGHPCKGQTLLSNLTTLNLALSAIQLTVHALVSWWVLRRLSLNFHEFSKQFESIPRR